MSRWRAGLLGALWLASTSSIALSAELPATMLLGGGITAGAEVTPREGDRVLAFSLADGQFLGDGPVSRGGRFQLSITRNASFNKTLVVLEIQHGRRRFALLDAGSAIAAIPFAGQLLPTPFLLDLRTGEMTAELQKAEIDQVSAQRLARHARLPCDASTDVNEDGRCDEADWAILRLFPGGITRTVGSR